MQEYKNIQNNRFTCSISSISYTMFCFLPFSFSILVSGMQRRIDRIVQKKDIPTDVAAVGLTEFDAESTQDICRAKLRIRLAQGLNAATNPQ